MKKRYLSALDMFIVSLIIYMIGFAVYGFESFLLFLFITFWVAVTITIFCISINEEPGVISWKNIPHGVPFTLLDGVTIKIKKDDETKPLYYRRGEYWYHIKLGLVHCTVKRSHPLTFEYGTTIEKSSDGQLIISSKKDVFEEFVPKGLKGSIDVA